MRRERPIFLLIIAVLAWFQNFLWSSPGFAAVPIKSLTTTSVVTSTISPSEYETYRLRGADLLNAYNNRLKPLVENLKNISPLLADRIKENFFGINWYVLDLKPNVPEEFGEVWIYRTYFSSLSDSEQTHFYLREILYFEFLRNHTKLQATDRARVEAIISAIQSNPSSIDAVAAAVDQARILQPNQSVWTSQLFLPDPSITNQLAEGFLFSYKGMRFLMRRCDGHALFNFYQRFGESGGSTHFIGLQPILERISHSGNCSLVDQKLYTIPLRSLQKANEQMRVELDKERGMPSFFWRSFAVVGSFAVFVNTHLIQIIRQPILKRFILDVIMGGAVGILASMYYKIHQNKNAPAPNPSTLAQMRLLADLQHNLKEEPVSFYKMSSNDFLRQTQTGLKGLQDSGYLEVILIGKVSQ